MFWPWDPLGTPLGPQGVPRGSQGCPKGVPMGCQGRFQGYSESSYACPTNEKVANPLRRGVDFIKWCFFTKILRFFKIRISLRRGVDLNDVGRPINHFFWHLVPPWGPCFDTWDPLGTPLGVPRAPMYPQYPKSCQKKPSYTGTAPRQFFFTFFQEFRLSKSKFSFGTFA